jgi:type I restriction enzyme R subunit
VIAVTSKLLSTGIDLPVVRNIVLFRRIGSTPEFKQTIGRGTRLCPGIRKASFDIIDFVEATRLFNDPGFDGPPLRVVRDTADETGQVVGSGEEAADGSLAEAEAVAEPDVEYAREESGSFGELGSGEAITDPDQVDRIQAGGRRYVVNGVYVYKWGERRYQLDTDGRTMRLVTIEQWVNDRVLGLDLAPDTLRSRWAVARSRRELISMLREADIEAEQLPEEFGSPDVDPIDLLLNVAWGLPLVSREERLHRFRHEHRDFLESFQPQARQVLEQMLQKFADHGSAQLTPETLEVPPFTEMGSVVELAQRFGGPVPMHGAVDELSRRLLEAS